MLEVGADRQAAGQAGDLRLVAQKLCDVDRRRLARRGRVRGEHHLGDAARLDAAHELVDLQVGRVDAVDRRERAAEHVVEAAELVRPLDRDHVLGLLDDADHIGVAARVLADVAARTLGQVEADLAQAHLRLHLADRVGEGERVVVGRAKDVEGEALSGSLPDPGQLRHLGDQPLDRLRVQRAPLHARAGRGRRGLPRRVRRARP